MTKQITHGQSKMTEGLQILQREDLDRPHCFRVAAYCRVSTNRKLQESSLETQMTSFHRKISETPGWILAGIYADKGISGTSAKGRVEFQRLMKDAAEGKFDYIMAKSISRFARNTVDALFYTRKLKEMGIGVYFEEQALDTLSATSEIFLTIHAAFAQEESYSLSENMKRGIRDRFALGIPKWSDTYGYRKDENGWHIRETEAVVVREIYRLYTAGYSLTEIRMHLERKGIPPPRGAEGERGRKVWWERTIAAILHNEKYIGDVEMQKSYTVDCLTRRRVSNQNADIPKYYKKDHHEPIIDETTYRLTQTILALRDRHGGSVQYPYYGYLRCPLCGAFMVRLRLPTRRSEAAWFCSAKCALYAVKEKYIREALRIACQTSGQSSAFEAAEYQFLNDHVEMITFDAHNGKINWRQLRIQWKNGGKTNVTISYDTPSDLPCTELAVQDGWVFLNGEKMTKARQTAHCIERIREYLRKTVVKQTGAVPVVLPPKTSSYERSTP